MKKLRGEDTTVVLLTKKQLLERIAATNPFVQFGWGELGTLCMEPASHSKMAGSYRTVDSLHSTAFRRILMQPLHGFQMTSTSRIFHRVGSTTSPRVGIEPLITSRKPPEAALSIAAVVHPSFVLAWSHFTVSKCPRAAAPSIAASVPPSDRLACSHFTTSRWPLLAAPSIAATVQPSGRFSSIN